MPCEYAGFTLKPFGFSDRNPGIDPPRRLRLTAVTVFLVSTGVLVSTGLLVSAGMRGETGMAEGTGLAGSPACT
jgi:hypothetical protein